MEQNIQNTIAALENRNVNEASVRQQYAMTHANNLALLLNELLENLIQQQSQSSSPGSGSCSKPGGMNPKPGKGAGQMMKDIITGQEQLGKGMQQGQGKQEGGKPGSGQGKQGGQSGEGGQGGDAEQLARMAQQQAALRRQIQELSSMLNSKGMNGSSKELRAIQEQMDKNETDMVNRRLKRRAPDAAKTDHEPFARSGKVDQGPGRG